MRCGRKSELFPWERRIPTVIRAPKFQERLEAARVRILRTDRNGAVHVLTDGQQIEIHCFVASLGAGKMASTLAKVPDQK